MTHLATLHAFWMATGIVHDMAPAAHIDMELANASAEQQRESLAKLSDHIDDTLTKLHESLQKQLQAVGDGSDDDDASYELDAVVK